MLRQACQQGLFRQDLYYRFCSDTISTVPLRKLVNGSPEELMLFILILANRILGDETEAKTFAEESHDRIVKHLGLEYPWPGNVRELEHVLERLAVLHPNSEISSESCDFLRDRIATARRTAPAEPGPVSEKPGITRTSHSSEIPAAGAPSSLLSVQALKEKQQQDDRVLILEALSQTGGNKAKAARLLGIDRSLLYYRMKKLGIGY